MADTEIKGPLDLTGDIIAYEQGDLDEEDTLARSRHTRSFDSANATGGARWYAGA